VLPVDLDIGNIVLENGWDVDLYTIAVSVLTCPINFAREYRLDVDMLHGEARCRPARAKVFRNIV
jgi:hypothetical protein